MATRLLLATGFVAVLLLAGCARPGPEPVHLTQANLHAEAGAAWEPPATVPQSVQAAQDWQAVALPHARPRSVAAAEATREAGPEVSWYRLALPPVDDSHGELFLYLPRWQTIGNVAVYADGRLLHRSRGSLVWNSFNRPLWVPLAPAGAAPPRTVLLRLASRPGVGGAVTSAWVGEAGPLLWRWRLRTFVQTDLVAQTAVAFLVIGLFSLAVWCVRRHELIYLLFFGITVTHALRVLQCVMGDRPPLLPDAWFSWITVNSTGWYVVLVFSFGYLVHRQRMPRLAVGIAAVVLLCSLATLPVGWLLPHLDTMLPLAYLVLAALTLASAVGGLWASWRARAGEGVALFACLLLHLPAGAHDLLMQSYRADMEGVYLTPYLSIGLFALFAVLVWRRYVGALAGAERQLAARERELLASHEQLRLLEREQALSAERQRLMQDMHDGIGSSLMSALRVAEHGAAPPAQLAQLLRDCIDDLKLAIDSLEPADADLLALLAAVRFRLAPRLRAAGITLTWSVQDLPPLPWLEPRNALHVLRIVQEVLTNILKHSGAGAIDLATAHAGDEVLVRIRDDGSGFSGDGQDGGAGKGLANVRYRTQALGARCHWSAWEGGGEFCLWLPLRPLAETAAT